MELSPTMLEWWQWLLCAIATGMACPFLIKKGARLQGVTDDNGKVVGALLLFLGYISGMCALGSAIFVVFRLVK
jgi:hypothetical protein